MNTLPNSKRISSRWVATGVAIALAGAAAFVPAYYAGKKGDPQEKESSRAATADQTTTLNDQTDLAVTVYNSNIALASRALDQRDANHTHKRQAAPMPINAPIMLQRKNLRSVNG